MSQDLNATSTLSPRPPRERPSTVAPGATPPAAAPGSVSVFDFTDYRAFLKAFYEAKRAANPLYTMSTFTRRAGFGENSRGYLKLVIEGKRNLTPATLRRFTDAIGIKGRDGMYFENLVYFNQAQTAKDKEFYFERLSASTEGRESSQFELLRSQHQFYTNWHYVAIRELVGLDEFNEDSAWISQRLRGKLSRGDVAAALRDLETLGLLTRDEATRRLKQSDRLVKYSGGAFNEIVRKFHLQMMDRARDSIVSDDYSETNLSCVTMACDRDSLAAIKKAISEFRDQITLKFGVTPAKNDTVIQLNFQLFQLTAPQTAPRRARPASVSPTSTPKTDS